jgi:hypothetical protein
VFVRGWSDRAVDLAFDRKYVYFGQDNQDHDAIVRADKRTGATSVVSSLPGASYSALRLKDGTILVGETHEPSGSIYVGQRTVHLYASRDGVSWVDILQRPIHPDGAGYSYIDAYYQYPDGSIPLLIAGYGTVVVRVGPPFPTAAALARAEAPHPSVAVVSASGVAIPPSRSQSLKIALVIVLFAMACGMLGLAAGVRQRVLDRGPIALGPVVVQPVELVAGAVSLVVAAIVTTLIA